MSEETQGTTCKKCGQAKKSCSTCGQKKQKQSEQPKKCDKCEKLKKGIRPYVIISLIMLIFISAGIYNVISYLIQLLSNQFFN